MDRAATISLAVDPALIAEAKGKGVDLEDLFERALKREIGANRVAPPAAAEDWRRENAEAIEAWNEDVRRNGLWCDGLRQF